MYVTEPQAHDSITQAASRASRGWLHPNLGNKPCSQLWINDFAAWLVRGMLREKARREEEREMYTHKDVPQNPICLPRLLPKNRYASFIYSQRNCHSDDKSQHNPYLQVLTASPPAAYSYHHSAKGPLRTTFACICNCRQYECTISVAMSCLSLLKSGLVRVAQGKSLWDLNNPCCS